MSKEIMEACVEKIANDLLVAANKTIDSLVNQAIAEKVKQYDTSYNYEWFKPEIYELPEFAKYPRERLPDIIGWIELNPDKENKVRTVYFTLCGRYFFKEEINEYLYEKFVTNCVPLSKVNYDKIMSHRSMIHVYACQGCCDFLNRKTNIKNCLGDGCQGGLNEIQKDGTLLFVKFDDYVSCVNGKQTYELDCGSSNRNRLFRVATRQIQNGKTEFISNKITETGNLTGQIPNCTCNGNRDSYYYGTKIVYDIKCIWTSIFSDPEQLKKFNNHVLVHPKEIGLQLLKAEELKQESDTNFKLAESKLIESQVLLEKLDIEKQIFEQEKEANASMYKLRLEQIMQQEAEIQKEKEKLIRQTAIVEKRKKEITEQYAKISEIKNLKFITNKLNDILLESELLVDPDRASEITELLNLLENKKRIEVQATLVETEEDEIKPAKAHRRSVKK